MNEENVKSLYDILKIPADASMEIVKSSYFHLLNEMTSSINGNYTLDDIENLNVALRYLSNSVLRYIYDVQLKNTDKIEPSNYTYDDIKDLKICDDQQIIDLLENRINLYNRLLENKVPAENLNYKKLESVVGYLEYSRKLLTGEYLDTWHNNKKI